MGQHIRVALQVDADSDRGQFGRCQCGNSVPTRPGSPTVKPGRSKLQSRDLLQILSRGRSPHFLGPDSDAACRLPARGGEPEPDRRRLGLGGRGMTLTQCVNLRPSRSLGGPAPPPHRAFQNPYLPGTGRYSTGRGGERTRAGARPAVPPPTPAGGRPRGGSGGKCRREERVGRQRQPERRRGERPGKPPSRTPREYEGRTVLQLLRPSSEVCAPRRAHGASRPSRENRELR